MEKIVQQRFLITSFCFLALTVSGSPNPDIIHTEFLVHMKNVIFTVGELVLKWFIYLDIFQ